jgi:hypothetical protein
MFSIGIEQDGRIRLYCSYPSSPQKYQFEQLFTHENTFIRAKETTKENTVLGCSRILRQDSMKRAGRTVLHRLHHHCFKSRLHSVDRDTIRV